MNYFSRSPTKITSSDFLLGLYWRCNMQWKRFIEDGYRNSGKMTTIGNVYCNYCEEVKNAPLLFDPDLF